MAPLIRIVDASLGTAAQVRLVVSGVAEPDRLRTTWASSGATVERIGPRLHATTTVVALTRAAGRTLDRVRAEQLRSQAEQAAAAWRSPSAALLANGVRAIHGPRPTVMGVLNVTPDSFSDGGLHLRDGSHDAAIAHGFALHEHGADIVDVGGESSRPGARPVAVDEELARVVPVVTALVSGGVTVSIDTVKAEVARAAVDAGVSIVNDVSGARYPELLEAVAETDVGYVLMHTRGAPADMQEHADYDDVVAETYEFLASGLERLEAVGIAPERVIIDPGIGFAKQMGHNLTLLRELRQFRGLARPVLVGASRKSFIGRLLDAAPDDLLEGSLAAAVVACERGAGIIRVHDVAETRRALDVSSAILTADGS